MKVNKVKGKTNPTKHKHVRDKEKQASAAKRQEKYNKLSLKEKIKRAENAPGNSERELARLNAQLEATKDHIRTTLEVAKEDGPNFPHNNKKRKK